MRVCLLTNPLNKHGLSLNKLSLFFLSNKNVCLLWKLTAKSVSQILNQTIDKTYRSVRSKSNQRGISDSPMNCKQKDFHLIIININFIFISQQFFLQQKRWQLVQFLFSEEALVSTNILFQLFFASMSLKVRIWRIWRDWTKLTIRIHSFFRTSKVTHFALLIRAGK